MQNFDRAFLPDAVPTYFLSQTQYPVQTAVSEHMKDPGANKWMDYATRACEERKARSEQQNSPSPTLSASRSGHASPWQQQQQQPMPMMRASLVGETHNQQRQAIQENALHSNLVTPRPLDDPPLCFCGLPVHERQSAKEGDISVYECGNSRARERIVCTFHVHKMAWSRYRWRIQNDKPVYQDDPDLAACALFNYTFCTLFQAGNPYAMHPFQTPNCFCNKPVKVCRRIPAVGRRMWGSCRDTECSWLRPAEDLRVVRLPRPPMPPPFVTTREDALIYATSTQNSPSSVTRPLHHLATPSSSAASTDILKLLQGARPSPEPLGHGNQSPTHGPSSIASSDAPPTAQQQQQQQRPQLESASAQIIPMSVRTRHTLRNEPAKQQSNLALDGLRRRLEQLEKKMQHVRMGNQRFKDQCSGSSGSSSRHEDASATDVACVHVPDDRISESAPVTAAGARLHDSTHRAIDLPQEEEPAAANDGTAQHQAMLLESLMDDSHSARAAKEHSG